MDTLFDVTDLHFSYDLGDDHYHALRGVSLSIYKGEFLALAGPSGSGKTTLLNLLGLIEPLQKGTIKFQNRVLTSLTEKEANHLRLFDFGFIFQQFHLIPTLSAFENIEYFLTEQGVSNERRKELVHESLESVLLKGFENRYPHELSGGQKQRVAIARAMAKKPKVIFADEPTASLDQKTGKEIISSLMELTKKSGVTLIMASHDQMVLSIAPKVVRLVDGKIEGGEK